MSDELKQVKHALSTTEQLFRYASDPSVKIVVEPLPLEDRPITKPTKPKGKIPTFHNGQYKAVIGSEIKTSGKLNGQRGPKHWMLGADVRVARTREQHIRSVWTMVVNFYKSRGRPKTEAIWTPNFIAITELAASNGQLAVDDAFTKVSEFNALVGDGGNIITAARPASLLPHVKREAKPPTIDANAPDSVDGKLTVIGAVKAFQEHLDTQIASNDRSPANGDRAKSSVRAMLRFLTDKPMTDTKLDTSKPTELASESIDQIGYEQINSLAANFKNRAVSGRAPATIGTDLYNISKFFEWLEDSGKWKPSCNYAKLLKVDMAKLRTLPEQAKLRSGQDTFTPAHIKKLYGNATGLQKLYLLLGLNLLATQQQISDLLVSDVNLDGKEPAVSFIRGKTRHLNRGAGVEGRYPLWPETVKALKAHLKENPPIGDYLISSEDGNRLVRYDGGKSGKIKMDSVRLTWDRLLKNCDCVRPKQLDAARRVAVATRETITLPDVPWLGFKHLRKTSGDAIKTLAGGGKIGEYMQELALAHANSSVASRNYSGSGSADKDFEVLAGLIMRVRTETLAEAF